jgi:hypothetical protein
MATHRTQNKVERELKKADKEYTKAEKGFQKGSIRRAEKHENRGMAHELKAGMFFHYFLISSFISSHFLSDGLTVGSRHGHNEGTRVAMLHNPQLTSAQPTIAPVAGPAIVPMVSSGFIPANQGFSSTGFEQQGQRGFLGQNEFLPQQQQQSAFGGQGLSYAQQSNFGQQGLGGQQQSFAPQQGSFVNQQQGLGGQQLPNTISIPHGPGMTTTISTHQHDQQRF